MEKLLLTGACGFLGRNIVEALRAHYDVTTCGISPDEMIVADFASQQPPLTEHYDIVVHASGKAHTVPVTDPERRRFFDVNFRGTINLCKALERVGVPKVFIFISSVAVYGRTEGQDIDENHPLNGVTPYAISKIQAEQYLTGWCRKHDVTLSILRPSLVAGPNPPGNLGAMISGIKSRHYLSIGKASAKKSMLMVDDIPVLIKLVAEKGGIYNVCSDSNPTFRQLEKSISRQTHRRVLWIPLWMAKILAKCGDIIGPKSPINTPRLSKITKSLTFSNKKAKEELGWTPSDVVSNFKIE